MENNHQPVQPPQQPPSAPNPQYQQTGYQPAPMPASSYAPMPNKSNTGLIIGLVIGGILLLLVIGAVIVVVIAVASFEFDKSSPSIQTQSTKNQTSTSSSANDTLQPSSKSAYTAAYLDDFSNVCDGIPIANAATFTSKQAAIIASFSKQPEASVWRTELAGYGKPYYLKDYKNFASVSVVSCFKATTGAETASISCTGNATDPTINYHSITYAVSFYEAKTGKKLADGGTVTGPADKCPYFASYNKKTLNSFAAPGDKQIEATLDTFVR